MKYEQRLKRKIAGYCLLLIFCLLTAIMISNNDTENLNVIETVGKRGAATLIIDPGHGGMDGGTSSKSGVLESEINLAISHKLEKLLGFLAYDSVLTRTTQELDYPAGLTTAQKKAWDQANRINLINSYDNAVLISIHQNYYPDSRPSGTQVFYGKKDGSKEFAELLHSNLNYHFYPQNRRVAAPISESILIMKKADCTAVLVECGFLSNASDTEKLRSTNHQVKISMVLAASYMQHISS